MQAENDIKELRDDLYQECLPYGGFTTNQVLKIVGLLQHASAARGAPLAAEGVRQGSAVNVGLFHRDGGDRVGGDASPLHHGCAKGNSALTGAALSSPSSEDDEDSHALPYRQDC